MRFDPITLSASRRYTDREVLKQAHINLDDYCENLYATLIDNILSGNTEFSLPVVNGDDLFDSINRNNGNVWLDIGMQNGGTYSAKVSGMSINNGKIFWVDNKIAAYSSDIGWMAMNVGININHIYIST